MTPIKAKELTLEVWSYLAEHPEIQRKVDLPEYLWSLYYWGEKDSITGHTLKDGVNIPGEMSQVVCACTPWGKPPDTWRPQ
jgi:hypothetical protein